MKHIINKFGFKKFKQNMRLLKYDFYDYIKFIQYKIHLQKLKFLNQTKSEFSIKENNLNRNNRLKIAFAVTECNENTAAGDYFTAMELGEFLKKFGWEIIFLPQKGSNYWYAIEEDVDVIISLLDLYNPRKIKTSNKSLIKIAWARNWFDRWISNPGFSDYDIIFASSKVACDYIKTETGKKCYLLPIATNVERFNDEIPFKPGYESDYCFTGSYWNYPRDIIEMLDPDSIGYHFKLYGKNWDKIKKFKKYYQGFIDYKKMPYIYASTKIVIDDANRVTKDFAAVNSRVFDAIASGAMVITNGKKGAEETFKGKLPFFTNKKELNQLIEYYLNNEEVRINKIKELQKFVLKNHTYSNRANKIKQIIEIYINKNF